jgi:hypothetical protein
LIFLERDPEKCAAVLRKDHAQNNNLMRDDDSSKSHRALANHPPLDHRDWRNSSLAGSVAIGIRSANATWLTA